VDAGGRLDVDVPDENCAICRGPANRGRVCSHKGLRRRGHHADHEVPEYVTVLSPPKSGLPFDFDQVRVFTWSLKHHRYETAFRLHPIQGFLPVRVSTQPGPGGNVPVFSFGLANGPDVSTDPATGITRPASARTINYEMLDTVVKRIGPDMGPIQVGHWRARRRRREEEGQAMMEYRVMPPAQSISIPRTRRFPAQSQGFEM